MDRQAIIDRLLEHYENPRHHQPLAHADVVQTGGLADCGDTITVYLKIDPDGEHVAELSFEGRGCTISQASASLLIESLQGAVLTTIATMEDEAVLELVGMEVARSRPRCATLALNTLKGAVLTYRRHQTAADAV